MKLETKGTYVGVRYSPKTVNEIKKFIIENNIINPVSFDSIHTTILYSRRYLPSFEPRGKLLKPINAFFKGFEIWKSQDSTKNFLVMLLDCPELEKLHYTYMKKYNATFDFPNYIPHLTLSYDTNIFDVKCLPKFDGPLKIVEEYSENLDLEWTDK